MAATRVTTEAPSRPPTGTVTFLFTDIEGSTRLVQAFGDGYDALLDRHRRLLRQAFAAHSAWEHGTEGDSFFVVFESAAAGIGAAVAAQQLLEAADWPPDGRVRVRMGLHTGQGRLLNDDYVGMDVHRAARIAAAGHGGQVLVSHATAVLVEHELPEGVSMLDLGDHGLKDLPRPEHLHQLVIRGLASEFPPLRAIRAQVRNLPAQLSSLIGRAEDLRIVTAMLDRARLITVTGAGGTGKTRLVEEVAREAVGAYPGGVTFVPLDAVHEAELIPVEIMRALQLDVAASRPPRERVIEHFADRTALLVLDNLEHLAGGALIVKALLDAAPGLTILASSRSGLHLAGEHEYALQPLTLPEPSTGSVVDLARLEQSPAVQLFVDRARAVRGEFALDASNARAIAAICAHLDGLPLAIELAAAQVKLLSPTAILDRISRHIDGLASRRDDLPERQRTLRAAVSWSYELLAEPERALFRRLSVMVGGARLADIEALGAGAAGSPDVLSILDGLVDASLVRIQRGAGEERAVMLETVRAFAAQLLREHGEDTVARTEHAEIYRDVAARAEAELFGPDRAAWLVLLADEHDNMRAALDTFEAIGNFEAALGMAADLWRFWQGRGHLLEGRDRLDRLLLAAAQSGSRAVPEDVLSRAEEAAGGLVYWSRGARGEEVQLHYVRSLEHARASGDRRRVAWALYNIAFLYDFLPGSGLGEPDMERATALRAEALEIFRELGDRRGIADSLWAMGGNVMVISQDPDRARELLTEAAVVLEDIGNTYGLGWVLTSFGIVESTTGRLAESRAAFLRGAELFLRDGDVSGQLVVVEALAALAALAGDDLTAVRLQAAVEAGAHEVEIDVPPIPPLIAAVAAAAGRISAGELEQARREGAAQSLASILGDALASSLPAA